TWLINQDNTVTASVYGAPTTSGGNGSFGISPNDGKVEIYDTMYFGLDPGGSISGSYSALAHEYVSNSVNSVIKWSSAFENKHLLFDALLGWHHEDNAVRAADGTRVASGEGLSTIPQVVWQKTEPPHSINDFEPMSSTAACDA